MSPEMTWLARLGAIALIVIGVYAFADNRPQPTQCHQSTQEPSK